MTGAEEVREEVFRAIKRGIGADVSPEQLSQILADAQERVDRVRVFEEANS